METAVREVFEETGVKADIDTRFREVVTYSPKKDVIKDVIYFFATTECDKTQKQESEVSEVMWVDIGDALKCVSYRNDKELVTKAIRFYKQHKKEIIK